MEVLDWLDIWCSLEPAAGDGFSINPFVPNLWLGWLEAALVLSDGWCDNDHLEYSNNDLL